MRDIRVATAQFEHRNDDKSYNLSRIHDLTRQAAARGAEMVWFHECAVCGYTFLQHLDRAQLAQVAEPVPDGPAVRDLIAIASEFGVVVGAGLIEIDAAGKLYNSYAAVSPEGFLACHRKLHTFISPHLTPGDSYTVVPIRDVQVGFLTCYDNNLPENVRITAMLGAEMIVMPHVTGCTPSPMPGRGPVSRELWRNRERNPVALRQEFDGPKGRQWLLRWLPARCWENGVYGIFSNPIGMDDDTVKPGLAMILDPFGEILAESRALGDDVVTAFLTADRLEQSSGRRYLRARRPELYGKLVEPPPPGSKPVTQPGWALAHDARDET